jgi:hypothetical protein
LTATATATCDGFFREIVHVAVNDHVNVNDNVNDHEKELFPDGN